MTTYQLSDQDLSYGVSTWAHNAQDYYDLTDAQREELEGLLWNSYRDAEERGDTDLTEDEEGTEWTRIEEEFLSKINS